MHLQIPHKLSKERAAAKVKMALTEHRAQIAEHAKLEEERWDGDTLHFTVELQGKTIRGTLTVSEQDFVLDATLPLLWRIFEDRIEAEVQKQMKGLV